MFYLYTKNYIILILFTYASSINKIDGSNFMIFSPCVVVLMQLGRTKRIKPSHYFSDG